MLRSSYYIGVRVPLLLIGGDLWDPSLLKVQALHQSTARVVNAVPWYF